MEVLEQLEQRLETLFMKLESLQKENAGLKLEHNETLAALQRENASLQEALAQEQRKNALAHERVDAILKRIKEQTELP